MALMSKQQMSTDGLVATLAAVNSTDTVAVGEGERVFLEVLNSSGSSVTVTLVTPGTVDGNAIADKAVAVAAGARASIGPINPAVYASGGIVTVTYSATTSVTAAAIQA